MKLPPYLLKLRFRNPDHTCAFWLPLFLIWPIVLVFLLVAFILLLSFALLTLIFSWQEGWLKSLFMAVPSIFRVFSHLSGLEVDAGGSRGNVHIELI